jgi:uncharacterized protein YqeY
MPSLTERLDHDAKDAMRAKEKVRLGSIRRARAALTEAEKRPEVAAAGGLDEEGRIAVVAKLAKQHRESIDQFRQAGRDDLVAKEEAELAVIEEYLPAQMGDEQIEAVVREVIASVGASEPRDVGKVMRPAMERLRGQADGGRVKAVAQRLLEG